VHFYAEHVVADAVHERVMREAIAELIAAEPDLLADVVFGIRAASRSTSGSTNICGGPGRRAERHCATRTGETHSREHRHPAHRDLRLAVRDWRGVLYPPKCPTNPVAR